MLGSFSGREGFCWLAAEDHWPLGLSVLMVVQNRYLSLCAIADYRNGRVCLLIKSILNASIDQCEQCTERFMSASDESAGTKTMKLKLTTHNVMQLMLRSLCYAADSRGLI
jgi:hypothetical protein